MTSLIPTAVLLAALALLIGTAISFFSSDTDQRSLPTVIVAFAVMLIFGLIVTAVTGL